MQKELRKFCPKCKTHTVQAVSTYKKGKDRKGAQGAIRHAEDKIGRASCRERVLRLV